MESDGSRTSRFVPALGSIIIQELPNFPQMGTDLPICGAPGVNQARRRRAARAAHVSTGRQAPAVGADAGSLAPRPQCRRAGRGGHGATLARLTARPRRGAAATCTASGAADPDHRHPAVRCPQRPRPVCVAAPCVHFGTTGGMDPDRTSAAKPARASASACQRRRSSPQARQHGPHSDAPGWLADSLASDEPITYPSVQARTCRIAAPRGAGPGSRGTGRPISR